MKAISLKSITKDVEVLISNELIRKKYILTEKLSDEKYKKEINMLKELKSKDFIIKDLLQTLKQSQSQFNPFDHTCLFLKLS